MFSFQEGEVTGQMAPLTGAELAGALNPTFYQTPPHTAAHIEGIKSEPFTPPLHPTLPGNSNTSAISPCHNLTPHSNSKCGFIAVLF